MNYYSVHIDPKEFPNPTKFNPDRFLDANKKLVGADRIIPFGLGKLTPMFAVSCCRRNYSVVSVYQISAFGNVGYKLLF